MFNLPWFNRREKIRRDEDIRLKMKEVIDKKHQSSIDCLNKLKERRMHIIPVLQERRST